MNPHAILNSGGLVVAGFRGHTLASLRAAGAAEADILAGVKDAIHAEIDAAAERLRMSAITPGTGQAMEYQQAQAEATLVLALKTPSSASPDKYPMLAASIGIDRDPSTGQPAADVAGVARSVDAARAAWVAFGGAIRATRLAGKKTVSEAADVDAACAAAAAIAWPSAG